MALKLATSPVLLASIKHKLQQQRDSSALFDITRARLGVESAYEMMWQRYQQGLPPAHFRVNRTEVINKKTNWFGRA